MTRLSINSASCLQTSQSRSLTGISLRFCFGYRVDDGEWVAGGKWKSFLEKMGHPEKVLLEVDSVLWRLASLSL